MMQRLKAGKGVTGWGRSSVRVSSMDPPCAIWQQDCCCCLSLGIVTCGYREHPGLRTASMSLEPEPAVLLQGISGESSITAVDHTFHMLAHAQVSHTTHGSIHL